MKKRFLTTSLVTMIALSLAVCGGGEKAADTTTAPAATGAPANTKAEDKAEDTKAEAGAVDGKVPEGYKGTVVVYSSHDTDPLNVGVNLFMEEYPNVEVEVVAVSIGELYNRITAGTASPITDVLQGGDADSLAVSKECFESYACANDEFIGTAYKDPDGLWVGESPLLVAILHNKDLIERDDLTIPEIWEDLTKSEWKGKTTYYPSPKPGSVYTQLCIMILGHGSEEDGWDFIKGLHNNLNGKIIDSLGRYHETVVDGKFYVGLTLEKATVQYKDDPSVGFVYPKDGTGAVPDDVVLIKGYPNEESVKLFIDFVTSKECQAEQNENWGRRPVRNDMEAGKGMTKLKDIPLVDYDFDWAANEREAIIEHFNDIMAD